MRGLTIRQRNSAVGVQRHGDGGSWAAARTLLIGRGRRRAEMAPCTSAFRRSSVCTAIPARAATSSVTAAATSSPPSSTRTSTRSLAAARVAREDPSQGIGKHPDLGVEVVIGRRQLGKKGQGLSDFSHGSQCHARVVSGRRRRRASASAASAFSRAKAGGRGWACAIPGHWS